MKLLLAVTSLSYFLICASADAEAPGMFLCDSPILAESFWSALIAISKEGVPVDSTTAAKVAPKYQCSFYPGTNFRPISYIENSLKLVSGSANGWAAVNYYILALNGGKTTPR